MIEISDNDTERALASIRDVLTGAALVGFRFGSNFTLYFDRRVSAISEGKGKIPWQLQVSILEDWWIGDTEDWNRKVRLLGQGVEPDEPVKAFELARLRWIDNATVLNVFYKERVLSILFACGDTINIQSTGEDEYSFSISGIEQEIQESGWGVTCVDAKFYINA